MNQEWFEYVKENSPDPMIDFFGEFIPKRLKNNYDFVGAITGSEGCGKSSLANIACMLVDPKFDLKKNVLYSPDTFELSGMVLDFKPGSAINADEAINILYKYEFNTKMQVALNKLYATCRKRNICSFFCMPDFTDLSRFFRRRTHAWIHVLDRGLCVVMVKDKNFVSPDRWGLKRLDKVMRKNFGRRRRSSDLGSRKVLRVLRASPTYFTEFEFPRMPQEMEDEYLRLSLDAGKKFDITNQNIKLSDAYLKLCKMVDWAYNVNGATQPEIASIIDVNHSSVSRMLEKLKKRKGDKFLPLAGNDLS